MVNPYEIQGSHKQSLEIILLYRATCEMMEGVKDGINDILK